jgi:hypothetical protein
MLIHNKETAGGFATIYHVDNLVIRDKDRQILQREFEIPKGYSKVEAWLNSYVRYVPFIDYEVDPVLGIFRFLEDCKSTVCESIGTPFRQGDILTIIGYMED